MKKLFVITVVVGYLFFVGCRKSHEEGSEDSRHTILTEDTHDHEEAEEHSHDDVNHGHGSNVSESNHQHIHEESGNSHEHENETNNETKANADIYSGEGGSHAEDEHTHDEAYQVEKIKPGTFHKVIRTSGEILSLPKSESVLVAPVSGVVRFSDNSVLAGRKVNNKNVLFWISGESVAEGNLFVKLQKSKATFNQMKQEYERAAKLFKEKLISEKEYLSHKTHYINARTEYETMKGHFSGESGAVKAPMKGYVKEIYINEGDYVQTGQKIATVVKTSRLLLKAEVSQKYASGIDEIVSANFETTDGRVYSTQELRGEMLSKGNSITSESFYLPVHFEIDAQAGLVPGSFAHIFLIGETKEGVIALPKEAFIEEQGNFFVFSQQGEEFIKKPVKTGASDGKYIQVLNGIEAGDRIVTRGAYHIKLMKASGNLPSHGHSH